MNFNFKKKSNQLSIKELDKAKEELLFITDLLFKNGLLTTDGGNISSRIGNNMVITPSGASNALLWKLTSQDLIVLDLEGRVIEGTSPSIETPFHIAIYRNLIEANAVIHSHTPLLSVFAKIGIGITENIHIREATMHYIPIIPFAKPGEDLANIISNVLKNLEFDSKFGKLFLLESHGVLSIGKNLRQAYSTLDLGNQMAITKILEKLLLKKGEACD